jgi:hypothetical protein
MNKLFPFLRISSIVLLFLTGINALIAGILFIIDPTGGKMGMSISYLSHSPFTTFLIPGITLFIVNGLLNVNAAVYSIKKSRHFPILIIIQGLLLSGWILIQVILVRDFNMLHFSMLSIGIILLVLGIILKHQMSTSSIDQH